jgi:stage III sporulation protein AH
MITKQNLWFLTLFSLILVLSVYYITLPNELLSEVENGSSEQVIKEEISEVSSLVAMRVSLEEERQSEMDVLQEAMTSEDISSTEKNNIYEKLKYLNEIQGQEELLEKKIKSSLKLDCFIKIDNTNVSSVCIASKHDNVLANKIMRLIQEEFKVKKFITVKFQNK